MNIISKLFLMVLPLLGVACQKNSPKPYVRDLPYEFNFTVLDSKGQPLLIAPDQKVVLSFLQNGQRKEITDYRLEPFPSSYPLTGYAYFSMAPALFSGNQGIREFNLELNGRVDNVYLDVEKHQQANAAGGFYTYRQVKFNGKEVPEFYQPGVFIYVFQQ